VAKETLINKICTNENVESIKNYLFSLPNDKLTEQLIEGTPLIVDNLTKFLSNERYSLQPLHNFFFIRDTSAAIRDNVLISCLSTQVREREAIIMDAIFNYHPNIKANTVNPINSVNLFTLLDKNKCMIYEPIVMNQHSFQTVHIVIDNGEISSIKEEQNILKALQKLGMEMTPIYCGGNTDEWIQEREQWHSGANFFALGPGKVIGYGRNVYTLEEMNKHGFEIIIAEEIINDKVEVDSSYNYVITVDGSELSRGGGGCRCMTTPIKRKPVKW
jgi:arginine deiminase